MAAAPYWGVHLIPLAINPVSLPNLLWWDDVGSIVPVPANGAAVGSVPVVPGTPTAHAGVQVKMFSVAAGTYDAAATHVGAVKMTNASYVHEGAASTIYAQSSAGGLTFYHRFAVTSNTPTFGLEGILRAPAGVSGFALQLENGGVVVLSGATFTPVTVGTFALNEWHTVALTVDKEPGNLNVWVDSLLVATTAETGIAIQTGNTGTGLEIGQAQPIDGFEWNTTLCYQAVHDAKTIKGVTNWLKGHR